MTNTQRILAALALAVGTFSFATPLANAVSIHSGNYRISVVVDVVHAETALNLGSVDFDAVDAS
jgi:hypothetical protein